MSPKKGVQLNRKSTEKTRTVRKVKAQLNKPANLKINIPLKISTEEAGVHVPIIKGRRPPQFTKQLDNKTKVELANSVARQQLVKEEAPVFQLDNLVYIKEPKTRGRKKKVISHYFENCIVMGNNTAEAIVTSKGTKLPEELTTAKKTTPQNKQAPTRRILTRKRLADSKAQDAKRIKVEPNPPIETLVVKLEDSSHVYEFDEPVEAKCDAVVKSPTTVVQQTPVVVTPQRSVAQTETEPTRPQPTPSKTNSTLKLPQPARKRPTVRQPTHPRMKRGRKGKQQNVRPNILTPSRVELLKLKSSEAEEKTKPNTPGLVGSRKNSVSSSSNKSWTREISSSSNNTCIGSVCSNDFVCIDNKLPVLKLTNIANEVKKHQQTASAVAGVTDEHLSDQYDSDSSDSERKSSIHFNDSIGANSLLLSSPSTQFTQSQRRESAKDYAKAARELSFRIKRCDIEMINWMGSENENVNANLLKLKNKISETFLNEFGTITNCRRLKEILEPPEKEDFPNEICTSGQNQDLNTNNGIEQTLVKENAPIQKDASAEENAQVAANALVQEPVKDFVTPTRTPSRKLSSSSEGNHSNPGTKNGISDDEMQADTSNTYYNNHDDDDALSLFAESITGLESSKMYTSTASAFKPRPVEEYIPQPVKEVHAPNTEKHVYCPTKIREDTDVVTSKITTVCEKQNADSTSILKQSNSTDDAESSHTDYTENIDIDTRLGPSDMIKKPLLMNSYFEGMPKTRSVVFGKLCFYNLMNCCRKVYYGQCRFLHLIPTSEQIKDKLSILDNRMVIQEYLLLRNWNEIRRKYGMCFVEECVKRGLTRILVEMAYDFIVKARSDSEEDTRLRVNTIEHTLLHLNSVDLSLCEDLLKLPILSEQGNRTLLCDVLMATMSITQNFSRFKIVFLNLTYFMVNNDRSFNKDVVEHIMERVCILPFEEPIAKAVIQMMRLTNSDIFNNSMIGHFEKQISVNKDVFEEYTLLKNQCALFTSMLASSVMSASLPLVGDAAAARGDAVPDAADPQPPAASPDTTNLDNMQKTVEASSKPVITRTIVMNPPITSNQATPSCGDTRGHVTTDSDTSDDAVKPNIRMWRNRSIFPKLAPPMVHRLPMRSVPTRAMRPPMHPHMRPPSMPFNKRLVSFQSPNYVNRHPGPKY